MNRAAGRTLDVTLVATAAGLTILIAQAALTSSDGPDRAPEPVGLVRDPLDLSALRAFGLRLDRQGHLGEADAVLAFVGRRTWRDGPTELWLLRRRLNQGRYPEAFESADSLLRRDADGATRAALFPLLTAAADDAAARPALVTRLAAAPWWRGDFLRALGAQGGVDGAQAVFSALARGPARPAPDEYSALINRLAGVGDDTGAYAAWRAIARRDDATPTSLRDGDFSGVSDHTPFTWSVAAGVGASSEAGVAPGRPGARALQVDYDGYSSPRLPAQLLVGPPRRYSLGWRERIAPPVPERLFWRVRCADTRQVLARAPPARAGWREATMTIEAPPSGCAAQWLELVAAPGERRAPVTAWYTAFRVRPIP